LLHEIAVRYNAALVNPLLAITVLIVTAFTCDAVAQRNQLRPADFEPLTELPWEAPSSTLGSVIDRIFRESNPSIRYPLLAEYLRMVPVKQLGEAFDRSISLEGTQTPDSLVEFFLEIWASRDPQSCWERTKQLFRVVGIEEGWLGYDDWSTRRPIEVQNLEAIQSSPFWLERDSLISFPLGVEKANVPEDERVRIMKEFTELWFATFKTWPGYQRPQGRWASYGGYSSNGREIIKALSQSLAETRQFLTQGHYIYDAPAVEIALRRWLKAEPTSALEVLKSAREIKWTLDGYWERRPDGPSIELLLIWAKLDMPGLAKWAESLAADKDDDYLRGQGFLLSRVDRETRERWLAAARSGDPDEAWEKTESLLENWAMWDPAAAADAALVTDNSETILSVILCMDGPWGSGVKNGCHAGIGFIKDFDVSRLPAQIYEDKFINWEEIMETWGEIDIGEAARYGFDFILRTGDAPREDLIKYFSGIDGFTDDAMMDRTFCSMRVWAVVRPKEMAGWIPTIKDKEMRNALWWLLQNPWGWGNGD
jgi:hypothetical protein